MKKLKITGKLVMMVLPSMLVLFAVIVFSVFNNLNVYNRTYENIYDQLYVNTELLLNADRDLYQALLAEQELYIEGDTLSETKKNELVADYKENYIQAQDRIASVSNNLISVSALYEDFSHEGSGKNLKTLVAEFNTDFDKWVETYNPETNKGNYLTALGYFDQAREKIDFASQLLDDYSKVQAEIESSNMTRNTVLFIIFGVVICAILTVIAQSVSKTIKKPVMTLKKMADRLAEGDLTVNEDTNSKDELGDLQRAFNKTALNLRETLAEINNSSEQVAAGSTQVSDGAQELSQGSTEQASATEQIAETVGKMRLMINDNAKNAQKANEISVLMGDDVITSNEEMDKMLESMQDINLSSQNISKIIKVIDDIAFQTNLLALNAAVEAAHAGQYGKGFAVVAEEVRKLAARSANAAKETTTLIEESIQKVNVGTTTAKGTAEVLEKIVVNISKTADIVKNISESSQVQATQVEQLNTAVNQISAVVQSNSATAEESAAASEELNSQVVMLKEMVNRFKI